MADIARLMVVIGANTQEFSRAMEGVTGKLRSWGDQMTNIGRSLTRNITLPLAGVATAALKMSMDFEESMQKIVGLVGVHQDQVDQWKDQVKDLSSTYGIAAAELAEALYFITSAGIETSKAMEVLEISAMAAASGLGETHVIADLVTSVLNAYGIENISAAEATDILVAAVREGKASAPEFAAALGTVLPVASAMGVTFNDVAAAMAGMTRTGTDVHTAATQLNAILTSLLRPTNQQEQAAKDLGLSFRDLRRTIREEGLMAALWEIREATDGNEEAMGRLFPNVRALRGVMDLLGDNAEENIGIFERLQDPVGALAEAFASAENTLAHKWNVALESAKNALLELGDALKPVVIPLLESFAEAMQRLTEWFRNLPPETQQFIVTLGIIAAALGPVALAIGAFLKALAWLGGVVVWVVKGLIAIGGVLAGLSAPVWIVIAAIVAVGAALVALWQRSERFREAVIAVWERVKDAALEIWGHIRDAALEIWEYLSAAIEETLEELAVTVGVVLGVIESFWETHGERILIVAEAAWEMLKLIIVTAINLIKDIIILVLALIRMDWAEVWERIKSIGLTVWNFIKSAATIIFTAMRNVIVALWERIRTRASEIWAAIRERIVTAATRIRERVAEAVANLRDRLAQMWENIRNRAEQIWRRLKDAVLNKVRELYTGTRTRLENLWSYIRSIPAQAYNWGRNIIQRLIDGFNARLGRLRSLVDDAVGTLRRLNPFSRSSPSLVELVQAGVREITDQYNKLEALQISPIAHRLHAHRTLEHTGVVTVRGVNDEGQMMAAVDVVVDRVAEMMVRGDRRLRGRVGLYDL